MTQPVQPANDDRADRRGQSGRNAADLELTEAQRHALIQELFAHWRAEGNQGMNCFCGSDTDLIRAVTDARATAAREQQRTKGRTTARTDARTSARGEAVGQPQSRQATRGELAERVAHLARTATPAHDTASTRAGLDTGVDGSRREQLLRWHDDDRAAAHGGLDGDRDGDG